MEGYIVDVLSLLLRWLHLIAGIAWIGASFYFVMLDSALKPPNQSRRFQTRRLRRIMGGTRRRLLQLAEIPRRA